MQKLEKLLKNYLALKLEVYNLSFELKETSIRRSGGYFDTITPDLSNCIVLEEKQRTKHLKTYICLSNENKPQYKAYISAKELYNTELKRVAKIQQKKDIKAERQNAIDFVERQINDGTINTNYKKVLILGNTNIYFAHPYYQHSDYNKHKALRNTPQNRKLAKELNKKLGYNN